MLVAARYGRVPPPRFDQSLASPDVGFCDGSDLKGATSDLLHAVKWPFGPAALDLGRLLWRRWMGRKIAAEAVPIWA